MCVKSRESSGAQQDQSHTTGALHPSRASPAPRARLRGRNLRRTSRALTAPTAMSSPTGAARAACQPQAATRRSPVPLVQVKTPVSRFQNNVTCMCSRSDCEGPACLMGEQLRLAENTAFSHAECLPESHQLLLVQLSTV